MFRDMGSAPGGAFTELLDGTLAILPRMFERGEYYGWLASPAGEPQRIVAGVGAQKRRVQPAPRPNGDGTFTVVQGRQALVVNVYTEPEFRRQGAARVLMESLMAWAGAAVDVVVLHAAPDGRALYESLGFKATNEMRYAGDIAQWRADLRVAPGTGR